MLTEFCEANAVPYQRCGKVIIGTDDTDLARLAALFERGKANGVAGLELIGSERLREIEPHARGIRALHCPTTAIVDFRRVAEAMAAQLVRSGVLIRRADPVVCVRRSGGALVLETRNGSPVEAGSLINCAGLHSDSVARMTGVAPDVRIIPFRGEYYVVRRDRSLVHALIYPVPDPSFPFLGVHFTRRITGEIEAGPNAVLAFAREGYRKRDVQVAESLGMLAYRGFWAMGSRYWRMGLEEMYRSFSRRSFVRALQRLVPDLSDEDVTPGGSGVRAQAVAPDGTLVDDFRIVETPDALHVLNAPSPAATASLAIGRHIAGIAMRSFGLRGYRC